METVTATELKRRLGQLLDRATLREVAVARHGRVVAYLVPASAPRAPRRATRTPSLDRKREERLVNLFASGDLRPSRWRRAGPAGTMAGFAALLAGAGMGDRARLFALAESLQPGMSTVGGFEQWLARSEVEPGRLLAMVEARTAERGLRKRT